MIAEGTRVVIRRPVERYPHFIAPVGATGVVTLVDDRSICVKLDAKLDGAEQWDNEVVWYDHAAGTNIEDDERQEFPADVEVLA